MSTLIVSSNFDSGNIIVEEARANSAKMRLRAEPFTHGTDDKQHAQWFYFKAANLSLSGIDAEFTIGGLLESSYPSAWPGYKVAASYDRTNWFRIENTTYNESTGELEWKFKPSHSQVSQYLMLLIVLKLEACPVVRCLPLT